MKAFADTEAVTLGHCALGSWDRLTPGPPTGRLASASRISSVAIARGAMSVYTDYSDEQQRLLRASLEAAAVVISAASPGRKEETVSEGFAAAEFVLDSQAEYVGNSLVSSVILALQQRARDEKAFPDYVRVATDPGAAEWARQTLRDVRALLEERTTAEEADGYMRWLMGIAQAAAVAGKEDQGFLGMGGVDVNDAERAALAEIATILGVEG